MDIITIIGILAGLLALIGGFLWEGGELSGLYEKTAILIVFGGTFAAVAVSFPYSRLKKIPSAIKYAFSKEESHSREIIEKLVDFSTIARRGGVLALEKEAGEQDNRFLKEGLMMVVDGTDPELTREIMELEMDAVEGKYGGHARIFEAAGGYAPTMGIIGTVMGLIKVLSNLADPGSLGHSIAIAFTATLYGVVSANLIYLPLASKIKARVKDEVQTMELMMIGILAIQAGESPQVIRKKLSAFILLDDGDAAASSGADGERAGRAARVKKVAERAT
ncbi:flagellar motor protein [Paenibacillus sp. GCM10023252]|uniref:flagellar motor protein n=1 Tax=Paenibacillus sp. GCM10023252 TaxID=3252649 RepID=UPI00360D0D08